jgi:hypothetical protein
MGLLEEMIKLREVACSSTSAGQSWSQQNSTTGYERRPEKAPATALVHRGRPPTSGPHGRRESGADKLRHESSQALDSAEYDRHADEMCDQEAHDVAHVEEFAAKANRDQQAGRETAERVREEALYGIEVYQAGDQAMDRKRKRRPKQ